MRYVRIPKYTCALRVNERVYVFWALRTYTCKCITAGKQPLYHWIDFNIFIKGSRIWKSCNIYIQMYRKMKHLAFSTPRKKVKVFKNFTSIWSVKNISLYYIHVCLNPDTLLYHIHMSLFGFCRCSVCLLFSELLTKLHTVNLNDVSVGLNDYFFSEFLEIFCDVVFLSPLRLSS